MCNYEGKNTKDFFFKYWNHTKCLGSFCVVENFPKHIMNSWMCLHNTIKNNIQWLHDGDITHDLVWYWVMGKDKSNILQLWR